MTDFNDFIEFVEYTKKYREVGPRRYLRDYSDPFTKYSGQEFFTRYRFTAESVKNVLLPMLATDLARPTKRGLPFAPEIMLLLTLRYFATGSVQKMDEDVMNICQQSVSRIITRVSILIASKMKKIVKFPSSTEDVNTIKQKFYDIANFPDVIGCIDCTHIKIRSPGGTLSEVYRNRDGWFSINVQAVIGPNLEFYDLVARWPGSTHDSLIYNSSCVKQKLMSGELNGIVLGDNGYAVSNVLLTPFLSPNSSTQENYNKRHSKTRNCVEKCFGIWKKRFPCLKVGMGIKIDTVVAVICACGALHNIALSLDDLVPFSWNNNNVSNNVNVAPVLENPNTNDFKVRQSMVERFFNS